MTPKPKKFEMIIGYDHFKRFDVVRSSSKGADVTVLKSRKQNAVTTLTVKNIKWSKYWIIRMLQRFYYFITNI